MASNPYVNKVETSDGTVIMDISSDTVTPSDVLNGVTFHDRSGAAQQGSVITHNVYDDLDSTSTDDALSANQGRILKNSIDGLNVYIAPENSSLKQIAFNASICPPNSTRWINIRQCSTSDLPTSSAIYGMARVNKRGDSVARIDIYTDSGGISSSSSYDFGATWTTWINFVTTLALIPQSILEETSFNAGHNEFNCSWSGYNLLLFAIGNYSNIFQTILVPVSEFSQTSEGHSLRMAYNDGGTWTIYKSSNTNKVIIDPPSTIQSNSKVRIWGIL